MPGTEFDMTRVQAGSSGGNEVAGIWSGTEGVFGFYCSDLSGGSGQYFLTISDDKFSWNCGTPTINADTLHSVFSVTKSIASLTLGAAWQNGLIDLSSLSITVDNAFSDLITDFAADDGRRNISLLDALHMRSGLEWNEVQDLPTTRNPMITRHPACVNDDGAVLCSILRMPLAYPPGTMWNYSENDSYLVSAFFHHLTGQSLRDYADQNIFSLIGMTFDTLSWLNIPDTPTNTAYTNGGAGLFLRTRDMARLALLTLYDGCWNVQQLVSYDWLQLSQTPIGPGLVQIYLDSGLNMGSPEIHDIQYGLHWWLTSGPGFLGESVVNARGMGGQFIYVFKDMEMVIVVTSNALAAPVETGFLNRNETIWDFLQTKILDQMID